MKSTIKSAQHLDELELHKLLKYLYKEQLWKYYLLVSFGASTALRYGDMSRLTWGDITSGPKLILQESKTSKYREIPLNTRLIEIIHECHQRLNEPSKDELVFNLRIRTVNKQIKIHANKCGIRKKRVSTHSLRKTFGRMVWEKNNQSEGSLIMLSHLFNHSSTAITRIYLDITREEVSSLYNLDFHV